MNRLHDERGTITGFVAVIALALVMVAGLVYDGGQILAAQATARDLAANAARAGAQQIDLDVLRADRVPSLDADAAEQAARSYLERSGVTGEVVVNGTSVTVTVHVREDMRILPVSDRVVSATDTATAIGGFTTGGSDG